MNPNHPDKPQVPEVEPLSADSCPFCGHSFTRLSGRCVECMRCGGSGPERRTIDEVLSAWNHRAESPELSALRAREERLWELVVMMEKDTEGATPTLADLAIIYYRKLIESILNEGKA